MRRYNRILLCITMLLIWLGPMRALAANKLLFDDPVGERIFVRDAVVADGSLYMLADEIWRYAIADEKLQLCSDGIWKDLASKVFLVHGTAALTVIDKETGKLGTITTEGIDWSEASATWLEAMDVWGDREVCQVTLTESMLYVCVQKSLAVWGEYDIWRLDLKNDTKSKLSLEGSTIRLKPYKEGKLLAVLRQGEENVLDTRIVTLDAETGEISDVLLSLSETEPIWDAAYDQRTDQIYVITSKAAHRLDQSDALGQSVAFLNAQRTTYGAQAEVLPSNQLAVIAGSNVGIYALNGDPPSRKLRIDGYISDEIWAGYNLLHPETPVEILDQFPSGSDAVLTDILSGNGSDAYVMNSRYGLQALKQKGYLASLSNSQDLVDAVQRMYPWAQELLLQDGRVVAFPIRLSTGFWVVDQDGMEAVGLKPPKTMDEFFSLIQQWEDGLSDQYPEYTLLNDSMDRQFLAEAILRAYVAQYEKTGEPLRLNTPIVRKVLEQCANAPIERKEPLQDDERQVLIVPDATPFKRYRSYNQQGRLLFLPPPAFEENQEMKILALMDAYVVNPQSPNADLAMQYLEYCAQEMDAGTRYLLQPDLSEPVRNPEAEARLVELQEHIKAYQLRLETAEPDEKKMLEDIIRENQASFQRRDDLSWLIGATQLAEYRKAAPNITLCLHSALLNYDATEDGFAATLWGQLSKQLSAYIEGTISLDSMLQDMDRRLQMAYEEGQ